MTLCPARAEGLVNMVSTTVWLHHLHSNGMLGEKAWRKLHQDAMRCFQQILEASPDKTAVVWSLTSYYTNHLCKMNSKTLFLYGHTSADGLQKLRLTIYVQTLKDLSRVMANRDRWWKSVKEIHTLMMVIFGLKNCLECAYLWAILFICVSTATSGEVMAKVLECNLKASKFKLQS